MDANSLFNEIANLLYKIFTILTAFVALKFTETGQNLLYDTTTMLHHHAANECVLVAIAATMAYF